MEKEEINIHEDMNNKTSKNSNGKNIIIVILLIIIAVLGTLVVVKRDQIFKTTETKQEEKENKNEEKKEIEKPEEKKETNESTKYKDSEGTIDTTKKSDEVTLNVNGKSLKLSYVDNATDSNPDVQAVLKINSTKIVEPYAIYGFGDVKYKIFTASDSKQYIYLSYMMGGGEKNIVVINDEARIIKEISDVDEKIECNLTIDDRIENGDIYYYRTKDEKVSSDYKVNVEEVKLTINNSNISETLTGNVKKVVAANCK